MSKVFLLNFLDNNKTAATNKTNTIATINILLESYILNIFFERPNMPNIKLIRENNLNALITMSSL